MLGYRWGFLTERLRAPAQILPRHEDRLHSLFATNVLANERVHAWLGCDFFGVEFDGDAEGFFGGVGEADF